MYYDETKNREYKVIVGHATVNVFARSRDEAIQNARMRLCTEMPRMWDVINGLDARSFQIESLHRSPNQ